MLSLWVASSVESEIGLPSSHLKEELEALDCLDAPTIPEPPAESLISRPTSPDVALAYC